MGTIGIGDWNDVDSRYAAAAVAAAVACSPMTLAVAVPIVPNVPSVIAPFIVAIRQSASADWSATTC